MDNSNFNGSDGNLEELENYMYNNPYPVAINEQRGETNDAEGDIDQTKVIEGKGHQDQKWQR
jgi:hypothetical protein